MSNTVPDTVDTTIYRRSKLYPDGIYDGITPWLGKFKKYSIKMYLKTMPLDERSLDLCANGG